MKTSKMIIVLLILSGLLIMCEKDDPVSSKRNPPACDISGTWYITITVTGGDQMPIGTKFTAQLMVTADENGNVTGSTLAEGGLTADVSGTVSDSLFSFKLEQNPPCIGTFYGSGTITDNCTNANGSYTGTDCNGKMKASFTSYDYKPPTPFPGPRT
jgi:hypothetical protein